MRPISLMCAVLRNVTSTLTRRTNFREWAAAWKGPDNYGGFAGVGVHHAVAALDDVWNTLEGDGFFVSLDMQKAFDKTDAKLAIRCLKELGMSHNWERFFTKVWDQKRFIKIGDSISAVQLDTGCLPQGDAFSVIAMSAVLLAATLDTSSQLQAGERQTVYLDDRNAILMTEVRAKEHVRRWTRWADTLGLKENASKMVIVAKKKGTIQDVELEAHSAQTVRALGHDFVQKGCRQAGTAVKRLQDALERAKKIKFLGFIGGRLQREAFRSLVVSKAAWGWWMTSPPKKLCRQFVEVTRQALKTTTAMASTNLQRMLRGHNMDLEHVAATQAMNMWMKTGGNTQGAWLKRIKAWHEDNGGELRDGQVWHMEGITWTPQLWDANKGKAQHLQREEWRRRIWYQFVEGKRHDAVELRENKENGYDENVCKMARTLYGSEHIGAPERKIMEGTATSELTTARWRKEALDDIRCHWCGHDESPSWEHLAWKCKHFSESRPKRPQTALQRRMGWPSVKDRGYDVQVLRHLSETRLAVLRHHFDDLKAGRPRRWQ